MNTFVFTLGPYTDRETPTGCELSLRSADAGHVELRVKVPKARKGQAEPQCDEIALGLVNATDLARVLGAIHALMGGPRA